MRDIEMNEMNDAMVTNQQVDCNTLKFKGNVQPAK